MRKRILSQAPARPDDGTRWLDFMDTAEVEITSEDPRFPIEHALSSDGSGGWMAGEPGEQIIRITFDTPQNLTRIRLVFREEARHRDQEFLLTWSPTGQGELREIVRQQFHFSPPGTSEEVEDYRVELDGVHMLQLTIIPDRSDHSAVASLARLQLA